MTAWDRLHHLHRRPLLLLLRRLLHPLLGRRLLLLLGRRLPLLLRRLKAAVAAFAFRAEAMPNSRPLAMPPPLKATSATIADANEKRNRHAVSNHRENYD
jgi:hypothetical protein